MNRDHGIHDAQVRDLLRRAGPRPQVPEQDLVAIRRAAREEWQALTGAEQQRRNQLRGRIVLALAASLLLAAVGGWLWIDRGASVGHPPVASIELLRGDVRGIAAGRAPGMALAAGTEIETAAAESGDPGHAALRWSEGQVIRLDSGTRLRLVSGRRLELLAGAVYFDSGEASGETAAVEIATPLGTVHEIGTRYSTRLVEGVGAVRVRVREGSVRLESAGSSHLATTGEELRLDRDGTLLRARVETSGPEWDWIEKTAPAFDIEGRPLSDYLGWISRETGRQVVFEDEGLEAAATEIILSGDIEGRTPQESLELVLPASDLSYAVDGHTVRVGRPAGGDE